VRSSVIIRQHFVDRDPHIDPLPQKCALSLDPGTERWLLEWGNSPVSQDTSYHQGTETKLSW
jgi:hypothetical protein